MRLTRSQEYAVHALLQLAQSRSGGPVSCNHLATCGEMPHRFLLQILRDLSKYGIVRSARGAIGGYSLAREPDQISLLDVVEATEGKLVGGSLSSTSKMPGDVRAKVQDACNKILIVVRTMLDDVKLAHFLQNERTVENRAHVLTALHESPQPKRRKRSK
jgi:Rrf2 family protein